MNQNANFFTRDRLRDIALGIGRGFQSYDPNNPLASTGAALEATIGSQLSRELREEARAQRKDDLDEIERRQREAEERAQEREEQRESKAESRERERERKADERMQRAEETADRIRKEAQDWQVQTENRRIDAEKERYEWVQKQEEAKEARERERRKNMQGAIVSYGAESSRDRSDREFNQYFASLFGGGLPRAKGRSPRSPYPVSTPEDKPSKRTRGMMRRQDGQIVKAIEDIDQDTPLFGEGGRDYAY